MNTDKHGFRKCSLFFGACVALLAVAGCETTPRPTAGAPFRESSNGVVEHAASGMRFPLEQVGFKRVGTQSYSPDGLNVSAGYNSTGSVPIAITVFVYPTPPVQSFGSPAAVIADAKAAIARGEFTRTKNEVLQVRQAGKLVEEQEVPGPRSSGGGRGSFARFAYTERFAGQVMPLESLLYVYCYVGDAWTVKYRITYPAASFEARSIVSNFVQNLDWTIGAPPNAATP